MSWQKAIHFFIILYSTFLFLPFCFIAKAQNKNILDYCLKRDFGYYNEIYSPFKHIKVTEKEGSDTMQLTAKQESIYESGYLIEVITAFDLAYKDSLLKRMHINYTNNHAVNNISFIFYPLMFKLNMNEVYKIEDDGNKSGWHFGYSSKGLHFSMKPIQGKDGDIYTYYDSTNGLLFVQKADDDTKQVADFISSLNKKNDTIMSVEKGYNILNIHKSKTYLKEYYKKNFLNFRMEYDTLDNNQIMKYIDSIKYYEDSRGQGHEINTKRYDQNNKIIYEYNESYFPSYYNASGQYIPSFKEMGKATTFLNNNPSIIETYHFNERSQVVLYTIENLLTNDQTDIEYLYGKDGLILKENSETFINNARNFYFRRYYYDISN